MNRISGRLSGRRLTPVTPWPAAGSLEAHIRAERVRVVFQQAPPAQLISIVAVAVICWLLRDTGNRTHLAIWFVVTTVITVARMALAVAFNRRAPPPEAMQRWETAFIVSIGGVCLAWGLGGLLIMPKDSVLHQAVVYFFLTGVAGGAVATYAAHPLVSAVAIVSLMVPATVAFALRDVVELRVLAAGGILYLGAALRSIRTFGFFLRRTFQLSFELHLAWDHARDQARTDDLTGLANRRAFMERGIAALEQARRYARPLTLVMFDIDHFKKINDTHGHAAGDAALRAVAIVVQRAARASDLPGRLGGEEFAVLLPETRTVEALMVAERLRRDIGAIALTHEGHEIHFTCSFGVAEQAGTAQLDQLLDAADAALYRAKAEGRNRVRAAAT